MVIELLVALLPIFLAIVAMWVQPPRKKHPMGWHVGLGLFAVCISALIFWQLYQHEKKSEEWARKAEKVERMLQSAQQAQRATQQKLDESIQREQRLNDQNNDFRTDLKAQNDLLQIMRRSLPLHAQKQADKIQKHYVREVTDTLSVEDTADVKAK